MSKNVVTATIQVQVGPQTMWEVSLMIGDTTRHGTTFTPWEMIRDYGHQDLKSTLVKLLLVIMKPFNLDDKVV